MNPNSIRIASLTIAAALTFAACGGDDDSATPADTGGDATEQPAGPAEQSVTVTAAGFQFVEKSPAVKAGGEVTFTHSDGTIHTLTARDGTFNTDDVKKDESKAVTAPSEPGTYDFYCVYHPAMTGTLTVQ